MKIAAVGTALPPHRYDQDQLIAAFEEFWAHEHHNVRRVRQFFQAVGVQTRHLALPMEDYPKLASFGESNDAFLRVGLDIGEQAIRSALDQVGLEPTDIDALFSVSVTGIGTPSLDARLFNRMGLRPDLKRTPIFGLGCVAGAAGLSRVFDYLKAYPDQVAVLLSVELCSLTLQRKDLSIANLVASGLFGDGAAAVVCVGSERADKMGLSGPTVLASRSTLYPNTERVMGWDIGETGFAIVLDASVPDVARDNLGRDVRGFLDSHGLTTEDVARWVCHPGGPKVLRAFEDSLGVSEEDLALTWQSLNREGNLSSASVIWVLGDTMRQRPGEPGDHGLVLAMGPGFCSEVVLLQW
jgi:alkylresorcinol/alkylpyrone synthase